MKKQEKKEAHLLYAHRIKKEPHMKSFHFLASRLKKWAGAKSLTDKKRYELNEMLLNLALILVKAEETSTELETYNLLARSQEGQIKGLKRDLVKYRGMYQGEKQNSLKMLKTIESLKKQVEYLEEEAAQGQ